MSRDFKNYSTAIGVVFGLVATVLYLSHVESAETLRHANGSHYSVAKAVYQQDVDHFSNDARAMSPRDWGGFDSESEPVAPRVTFGEQPEPVANELQLNPDSSRFQQAEHGTLREPKNFYETDPIESDQQTEHRSQSQSSPLPSSASTEISTRQQQPTEEKDSGSTSKQETRQTNERPLESRIEPCEGPVNSPGLSNDQQDSPKRAPSDTGSIIQDPVTIDDGYSGAQQLTSNGVSPFCDECGQPFSCCSDHTTQPRKARQFRRRNTPNSIGIDLMSCNCVAQDAGLFDQRSSGGVNEGVGHSDIFLEPKFNPNLGHRDPFPVTNQLTGSSGETFPFDEEDQPYPSMREILASSVYFAEAEFMFLEPSFSGNSAIIATSPVSATSQTFNFDLEPAFRVMAGYESEYGPGFAGEYFQFDNNSDCICFTSDGITIGETRVYQLGQNRWTSILAVNPGETINTFHSLEVHSTGVYAFKALKFKRAYVNGKFGIQVASIDQKINANLLDAGGSIIGRLRGDSNLNAFGPRFGIDYVRRIGHTPMQIVSSATGSILFGDRDQEVTNTFSGEFSSAGSDEFVTVIDIFFGVQAKQHRGEKKNTTMRLGFVNQSWIGGGTAIDPNGDFGFQGVSLMLGFNR